MADKPVRIRIQHDGKSPAYMAKVTDAETDTEIYHVKSVELRLNAAEGRLIPIAHMEVYAPFVDIESEVEVTTVCPQCSQPLQNDKLKWTAFVESLFEIAEPGKTKDALWAVYQSLLNPLQGDDVQGSDLGDFPPETSRRGWHI